LNQSKSVLCSSSVCKNITILLLVVLLVTVFNACTANQQKDTTKSAASSSMATLGPASSKASSVTSSAVVTTDTSSATALATSGAATTTIVASTAATTTTPVTAATTAIAATTAVTAATTVSTAATTAIATGVTEKRLGFMLSASSTGPQTIRIDYIDMFTGAEAIVKAREDSSPLVEIDGSGHYYIPNDYYIRNNNPLIRTFPLATGCIIKMIGTDGGPIASLTVTFAQLRTALALAPYHPLMEINVVNGQVTTITEFYLP
jgi:hypothetical protein